MKIDRRNFLAIGAAAGVGAALKSARAATPADSRGSDDGSIVIDGCGGPGDFSTDADHPLSDKVVDDARRSGVTAVNLTVGPVGLVSDTAAFEGIVRDIAFWSSEAERRADAFRIVRRFADIDEAKASRRMGIVFGLQDGVSFAGDLTRLKVLHQLGIRIIQPTYNRRNLIGDGCLEPADAGLSRLGREAIERMDELKIVVDLSHCGKATTRDAVAASKRPVAFTHTGCAALTDHPRNKSDEALRSLAARGGVAGIYFMPYLRKSGQQQAADVIAHLEHAVNVAGEEHVGIGTDGSISQVDLTPEFVAAFRRSVEERRKAGIGAPGENDEVYLFAPDLNSPRRLETLAGLLRARGHKTARVEKILGGNFARLFKEVWG